MLIMIRVCVDVPLSSLARLYSDPSWSRASSLAPLAFKYAESHVADYPGADGKVVGQVVPADPVALTIVQNAADYLVNSVRAVANKLNFTTSKEPVTVSVVETNKQRQQQRQQQ